MKIKDIIALIDDGAVSVTLQYQNSSDAVEMDADNDFLKAFEEYYITAIDVQNITLVVKKGE